MKGAPRWRPADPLMQLLTGRQHRRYQEDEPREAAARLTSGSEVSRWGAASPLAPPRTVHLQRR